MTKATIIDTTSKQDNYIEVLKQHFPSAISQLEDGSYILDKEQLQMMLEPKNCKLIEDGYGLKWVGKKEAYHNAYIPNHKILKPLIDESKNFTTTSNVLIKGDNLEVLKLLSKNYFEKIKMIYIDPPYNTENDGFIYNDNYTQSQEEILDYLGYSSEQKDYIKNIAGAKTHSGWLSFMYPRLLLARDLLKDDGVIFISINDKEQANLKLLCDEVFGQENFIAQLIWANQEGGGGSDSNNFRIKHEYILCYAKVKENLKINGENITDIDRYKFSDKYLHSRGKYQLVKLDSASLGYVAALDYEIIAPDGSVILPNKSNEKISRWRWSRKKLDWGIINDFVVIKKDKENKWAVYTKQYTNCDYEGNILLDRIKQPLAIILHYSTTQANNYLENIFNGKQIFKYSKPLKLLEYLICRGSNLNSNNDIILDFFAGSGTTGDAVMQLNATDGGNRKYILVQISQPIDSNKNKEAYNFVENILNKEPTIFEITAERLRRAGEKILMDNAKAKESQYLANLDIGFKVYEVTSDSYHQIYDKAFNEIHQSDLNQLLDEKNNIKPDSNTILTNLMLGSGVTFDAKVATIFEGSLYRSMDKLFILKEFELELALFAGIEYVIVYVRDLSDDNFLANLTSFIDKDKIIIKG